MACAFTPAKYAGITMLVEGSPRTGVFTNPEAPEVDEAQYRNGEGPCMYAFRDQVTYRIDSTVAGIDVGQNSLAAPRQLMGSFRPCRPRLQPAAGVWVR